MRALREAREGEGRAEWGEGEAGGERKRSLRPPLVFDLAESIKFLIDGEVSPDWLLEFLKDEKDAWWLWSLEGECMGEEGRWGGERRRLATEGEDLGGISRCRVDSLVETTFPFTSINKSIPLSAMAIAIGDVAIMDDKEEEVPSGDRRDLPLPPPAVKSSEDPPMLAVLEGGRGDRQTWTLIFFEEDLRGDLRAGLTAGLSPDFFPPPVWNPKNDLSVILNLSLMVLSALSFNDLGGCVALGLMPWMGRG